MQGSEAECKYSLITEYPGAMATGEQAARLYQRYRFVKDFCADKDILEVACGCGIGLGYLDGVARSVRGVDIDETNVETAKRICSGRENVKVSISDANELPLPERSADVVLLFEALYYLSNPDKFVKRAKNILKEDGVIVLCTVNKDWEDFHPSLYARKYHSVPELYEALKGQFEEVKIYGGFPVETKDIMSKILSLVKRRAVKYNLIPGSLKARAYLKKIFIGKLVPLPNEVYDGMAPYADPVEIDSTMPCKDYKIIYAVARK